MRLKTIVNQQRFDWVGYDESRPLPVSIPSMPLSLTVVLTGDRESLADFQEMEPELAEQAVYSEYEDNIQIADADDMAQWCQWVMAVAERFALPTPAADAWPGLIREAVRYTGDQETLPLCPLWIGKQLREVGVISGEGSFTGNSSLRCWLSVSGAKAILLTACRMKFCWNKFWWKPKANASGRSTPCR
jgi:Lon-like ATP-dependent protease